MPFDAQAPAEVTARDRLVQLRDFLETLPPEKFVMESYFSDALGEPILSEQFHKCGTAACIAGWAIVRFGDPETADFYREDAAELLGLDYNEAAALFEPLEVIQGRSADLTTARAVAVLDHYLATGLIDWSVA